MISEQDERWMRLAIAEAKRAESLGEVPIGAVLIEDEQVIGKGCNQVISLNDPSAHAEVMALRNAGQFKKNYRFPVTTLYVTLEPCMMCAIALLHARISRLVFAAFDPKVGCCSKHQDFFQQEGLNHRYSVQGGVLEQECSELLRIFFRSRR